MGNPINEQQLGFHLCVVTAAIGSSAHFHSVDTFTKSMKLFVSAFNTISHRGDILVFRNTVPGHDRCFDPEGAIPVTQMTHNAFLDRYHTSTIVTPKNLNDINDELSVLYLNVQYDRDAARFACGWR